MPFRKNMAKVVNKDKILTGKLMQMSLIVDDHIYKNKRISVIDAMIFLRDLASLREQTKKHIRLSQVAEKLTRVMRGIIAEDQDVDPLNIDYHLRTNSQTDNDRSEMSQAYFANDEIQKAKDKRKEEKKRMLNDIEIVCISDEEMPMINLDANNGKNSEAIESEISAKISNLTMHEMYSTPIPSNYDSACNDCSQSILINYENDATVKKYQQEQPVCDVLKNIIVSGNRQSSKHPKCCIPKTNNTKENIIAKKTSAFTTSTAANHNKNDKLKGANSRTGRKTKINISASKSVAKKPGRHFPDKFESLYESVSNTANNPTEPQKIKARTANKQMKVIKAVKADIVKRQMEKFDEIKEQKKDIDTNSGTAVHTLKDPVEKMPVEIDLSWIESIKYVRIIEDSEYIPTYQSVWDNCEFPQSWDERDDNSY